MRGFRIELQNDLAYKFLENKNASLARIDLGFSKEGLGIYLQFNHIF